MTGRGRAARRVALAGLLTAGASGCLPFVTTEYWEPAASGGRVVRAHCPPDRSIVLLQREGVVIGARVGAGGEDRLAISMTLEVPEGRNVRLLGGEVEVRFPDGEVQRGDLTGHLWVGTGRTKELPADVVLPGESHRWRVGPFKQVTAYGTTRHAYYWFTTQVPGTGSDRLVVKLPDMAINDRAVDLPEIQLRRASELHWIYPLNC